MFPQKRQGVTNVFSSRKVLGKPAEEGESPVDERGSTPVMFPSRAEHVKFRLNPGGPPSKAKDHQPPIAHSTERER